MKTARPLIVAALAAVTLALAAGSPRPAMADEGMWLPNKPPVQHLKDRYGFEPTGEWLERMQRSAVRFSTGGSGSIVSARGLVLTNHHVGSDMIAKLSTPERDLMEAGFLARSLEEELPCPDLELNVLMQIEDVTARVLGAGEGLSPSEANAARRREMATIEQDAKERTGLDCQVVTLYQGGQYHLYCYRRHTDVRLVFAPELQAAFFGGDTDNFEYPRFNLDACFFRIYEDGRPLETEDYLRWSSGSKEGDLAIVFGHPGRTSRLHTVDHLRFLRDVETPRRLMQLAHREVQLQVFSGRSPENERIAQDDLHSVANGRKALTGRLAGLQDPSLIEARAAQERRLREHAAASGGSGDDPWALISGAQETHRQIAFRRAAVNGVFSSDLAGAGLTLLRLADELPRPSAERLREFRDTALPSVYLRLFSDAPIYDDLETDRLASALSYLTVTLGADDPVVRAALAGRSPLVRAQELVAGTALKDISVRRALADGGAAAVSASDDPMLALARALDAESRRLRKIYEDEVEARERLGYARIAELKFDLEGDSVYPDATFTLRMSFGPIIGWEEAGEMVPPYTTFAGLYERHAARKGVFPFNLPQRWLDRRDRLDLSTPYNFVCTADIIGGNSGSPVVNTRGEVIGLIFDGNIHSLIGDFVYDDRTNRAVSVDSRAIIEALRSVYDAHDLAAEITGRKN